MKAREIKFRAWTGDHWINEGMIYDWQDTTYMESIGFNDKDVPIMQYTGLKDKNGVEIYEGDIVELSKHMNPAEVAQTNVVKWDDKKPGWSGVFPNLVYWQLHKVIGNIHENPELINSAQ